jgi:hypothetical protein
MQRWLPLLHHPTRMPIGSMPRSGHSRSDKTIRRPPGRGWHGIRCVQLSVQFFADGPRFSALLLDLTDLKPENCRLRHSEGRFLPRLLGALTSVPGLECRRVKEAVTTTMVAFTPSGMWVADARLNVSAVAMLPWRRLVPIAMRWQCTGSNFANRYLAFATG